MTIPACIRINAAASHAPGSHDLLDICRTSRRIPLPTWAEHVQQTLQSLPADLSNLSSNHQRLKCESGLQAVRQVEQQLVLESLIKFMNTIDGRGMDQESLDAAKTWSLHDLEAFFQV